MTRLLDLMPQQTWSMAIDLRGRGLSTWPQAGYRLANYVEDILDVINTLAGNRQAPVLVGHSMGARIAAAFSARHGSLVAGAVLIDPPVNGPGMRQSYPKSLSSFIEEKTAAERNCMEVLRRCLPTMSQAALEERADEYRNCSQHAMIESYESFLRESFHVHVKAATCPMLLLAAEHGDTIRDEELDVLAHLNRRIECVRMPGVGHMIYKEAPEQTARHIVDFVGRLDPEFSREC
jgi:N-formylmaleamate deformylase